METGAAGENLISHPFCLAVKAICSPSSLRFGGGYLGDYAFADAEGFAGMFSLPCVVIVLQTP
jgi:hypothetical protein